MTVLIRLARTQAALMLALASIASCAPHARGQESEDPLAAAAKQMSEKRYKEAAALLDEAIKTSSDSTRALVMRAQSRRLSGELPGALADCNAALKTSPRDPGALLERAEIMVSLNMLPAAIADCNSLLAQNQRDDRANRIKGNALSKQGDFARAFRCFNMALRANPDSWQTHMARAACFELSGNLGAAVSDYSTALLLNPGADCRGKRADIYFRQGKWHAVVREYAEYIKQHPDDARAYDVMGRAYYRLGKTANAIESFKKSLAINPNNPALKTYIAQTAALMNSQLPKFNDVDAVDAFQRKPKLTRSGQVAPDEVEARVRKMMPLLKQIDSSLDPQMKESGLLALTGAKQFREGQFDAAVDSFTKSIAIKGSAISYEYRALSYERLQRFSNAIDDMTRSISAAPTSEKYLVRARMYEAAHQHANAVKDQEMAKELARQKAH